MSVVGLFLHLGRESAVAQARELAKWLIAEGHGVRLPHDDADAIGLTDHGADDETIAEEMNLAVSLGGDGTVLRTAQLVADHGVPLLGINHGHLGYLTEVEAAGGLDALERCLAGDFETEERMRVEAEVERPGSIDRIGACRGLNEIVLEKVDNGRIVRLSVELDGEFFTTYAADGLIVATPTGSTAYSLSARGPIVDPTHEALILTPLSPHMLFDRSLVLSPESTIRVEVLADRSAEVAADGDAQARLEPGDVLVCRAAAEPAHLVTFGRRDFHRLLKTKLGLNDR